MFSRVAQRGQPQVADFQQRALAVNGVHHDRRRDVGSTQTLLMRGQRCGCFLLLGDVFDRTHIARHRAIAGHVAPGARAHSARLAVGSQNSERHVELDAQCRRALPFGEDGRTVIRVQSRRPAVPQALRKRQPIDGLPAPVGVGAPAMGIGGKNTQRRNLTEGLETGLALGKNMCCTCLLANVPDDLGGTGQIAHGVDDGR